MTTAPSNNDYAARLQALLSGADPAGNAGMTADQLNAQRARNEKQKMDQEFTTAQTAAKHARTMDVLNAGTTRDMNQHRQTMDVLNAGMAQVNANQRKLDYTLKERVHDETTQLKRQHEENDYSIRMREQLRKDREMDARLAREQVADDRELQQSLQHTQIHTRMQHSTHREAQNAARLITSIGCFTCEGTETLVNELLQKRMQTNPMAEMPQHWRDCVSETITSHGEMVVGDLGRRYERLRRATLDNYVLTDNDQVHTTFARAVAAQIRHTAVSSGLSYKSKYALEATQQAMGRAIRFFERVAHTGGNTFEVVHDAVDTGLPARSVARFRRRGGVSWASPAPQSFWA